LKKKAQIKKIRLHRETLRQLDREDLDGLHGGLVTYSACHGSCMASCACGGTALCTNTNCSGCC